MNITKFLVTALFVTACIAQDFIFPDQVENATKLITETKTEEAMMDDRIPVAIPGRCAPNELLYPIGQKKGWICDCGPGFIYYKIKSGCFKAYRQGPCDKNKYLIVAKNEVTPKCIQNPCSNDGFVKFHGKCYELDKPGAPCGPTAMDGGIFGVNSTTLELECLKGSDALSLISFPSNCPKGSKRGANHCRPPY